MYERFTDRARKTFQLANTEAQRFNHEYIGTEHILLGLIKEGGGVAAEILRGMKIDLRKIRLEVEKVIQSGPDMVLVGKLPQTPRTKKVIEYAMQCARERNDNYVGTFHLLMGLLREKEGVAAQILRQLNVCETVVVDAEKHYVHNKGLEIVVGELEDEKQAAIANQDFEKASKIRDRIDGLVKEFARKEEVVGADVKIDERLDLLLQGQAQIIAMLHNLSDLLLAKANRE